MLRSTLIFSTIITIALIAPSCKKEKEIPSGLPPLPSEATPGHGTPAGHPAVESTDPKLDQKLVDLQSAIKFDVPSGWKRIAPRAQMRAAELVAPRAAGDAADGNLIVSIIGGGGTFESNVVRWLSQLKNSDGSDLSREQAKTSQLKVGTFTINIFEAGGSYLEKNMFSGAVTADIKNAKMIVAMLEDAGAAHFFKFTGPAATIAGARPAFEGLLKSIRK